MPLQRLEEDIGKIAKPRAWLGNGLSVERLTKQCEEMASRLRSELEDVKERLTQGLDRCDQFWVDRQLLESRHSQSTTLFLHKLSLEAPLEEYSRELKQNKSTTHITFFHFDSDDDRRWIVDTIRDLPWVTSIRVPNRELLPAIDRTTPLFIYDDYGPDIEPFLENDPQLAHSHDTFTFLSKPLSSNRVSIAVSFVGPTSGNLILRLKHHSASSNATLEVEGTSFQLSLSSSFNVDEITLHASPSQSDMPSFEPGIRNNLIIHLVFPTPSYAIYGIQLLDYAKNPYNPASQRPGNAVETTRCVLLSHMIYCRHSSGTSDLEVTSTSPSSF
jgi:hypothetical protein